MIFLRIVVALFLIFCSPIFSHAQTITPAFRHFTTEDGLPSSEVYTIHQDKIGNIWFGTDRGLACYDGYSFRTYSNKEGLTDNTVFKIFENTSGQLALFTFSGKIFFFEKGKIFPYRYNNLIVELAQNRIPSDFYIDTLENVYLSFRNLGNLKITSKGKIENEVFLDSVSIMSGILQEVAPGKILTSLNDIGLIKHRSKFIVIENNQRDTISIDNKQNNRMAALRYSKNTILFSCGNKLLKRKEKEISLIDSLPSNILSISKDDHNRIWASTENGVFCYNDPDASDFNQRFLEKYFMTCTFQDNEGGYWFSTVDNGIYYMPLFDVKGILFTDSMMQKPICLTNDFRHTVYAGCFNSSLVKIINCKPTLALNTNFNNITPLTNLTSFQDDDKIYLSYFKPGYYQNGNFTTYKIAVPISPKSGYIKMKNGDLFCAGSSLVIRVRKDSIAKAGAASQRILCIGIKNDSLLLGGSKGVMYFDKNGNSGAYRKDLRDIRVDDIKTFGSDLAFATKGNGLLILHNDSVIRIDETNGLCSNLLNKLFIYNNEIWCASNNGISQVVINDRNPNEYSITNIHGSDGLFSDEISDINILNDTVYVATNYGITFFLKNVGFYNQASPFINITSLRVNSIETNFDSTLKFSHEQNNIHISFTGISYRSQEKILYRYKLIKGKDTLASTTNSREVEFLNLHPGKYLFAVAAKNKSGQWSTTDAGISFIINPAWWQTIWFRVVLIVLFLLSIYYLYQNKLMRVKKKFEIEKHQASLQLTAMRAQMNPHFIFNVMNSIRNYMLDHDIKSAEKYLISFSQLVRYTLDNSEVQEVTLEEELNALRSYTELEMQRFEYGFEFNIICEEGIDLSDTMVLSMLLQPFVENSIKHGIDQTKQGGKILIDIRMVRDKIMIGIEDNGVGYEEGKKVEKDHISRGTSLIFERIVAYNKVYHKGIKTRIINLYKEDGKSSGTRVEIEL